jgi:hypothetical protein
VYIASLPGERLVICRTKRVTTGARKSKHILTSFSNLNGSHSSHFNPDIITIANDAGA